MALSGSRRFPPKPAVGEESVSCDSFEMMKSREQVRSVTLGLECGVGQGSVALLVDGLVAASTADGTVAASRAENILGIVKAAVASSGVNLHAIDLIAV